ncbi:hypothetical protein BCU19_22590 (plasmid) [Vibrio cyclitrophicus]|uniref:hypothetical protein n=1 Tax=Vibrio cyclitrophicus TaxID=47951 RepID=UPI000C81DB5A|nr:hypothetical protein [Vibrio cyclitrophicus]PMJ54169.1 hypothetical protein BCU19_18490 [Vibrio cyclitrophicus]
MKNNEKETNYSYEMLEKDFVTCRDQFIKESGLIPKGKELFVFIDQENKEKIFTPYLRLMVDGKQYKMTIPKDYLEAIFKFVTTDVALYSRQYLSHDIEVCRLFANSILYCTFLHEFSHFIRNHHNALNKLELEDSLKQKVIEIDADVVSACLLWGFIKTIPCSRNLKIKSVVVGVRGQFEIVNRYFVENGLTSSYELEPLPRAYIALCNMATAPVFIEDVHLECDIARELKKMEKELFKRSWIGCADEETALRDSNLWHDKRDMLHVYAHTEFENPEWFSWFVSKQRKLRINLERLKNKFTK